MADLNEELNDALGSPAEEEAVEETPNAEEESDESDDGEGTSEEVPDEGQEEESEAGEDDGPRIEEDEELAEASPVNLTELTKKYPKLFAEHPKLRDTIIREQKFTEVFPTIEMAQEAYDRSESFKNFNAEILSGRAENLLENIKRVDQRAFNKFTDNILDSLYRVDAPQFNKISSVIVTRAIKHMYSQGKRHGNENIEMASRWMSRFFFENDNPESLTEPEKPRDDEASEERQRINAERAQWTQERYTHAANDIHAQLDRELVKRVENGLDPNNRLSKFAKDALVDRIIKELNESLGNDPRHNNQMKLLWARAAKSGYSAEWRNKIRDAVLANAERRLPVVRQKHRANAFKDIKPGKVNENKVASGRSVSGKANGKSPAGKREVDYSKTTDADILSGNITYKKS